MSSKSKILLKKRKIRNRFRIKSHATCDFRLSVFRSNTNFYCQIINDEKGITLLSVSSLDKNIKKDINNNGGNIAAAKIVGAELAKKAKDMKITKVFFDRGEYKYHGRVKLLADELRKNGMEF